MDKAVAKELLVRHGLRVANWIGVRENEIDDSLPGRVGRELEWPVFVKPANLGSSVGVTKAGGPGALMSAIDEALRYDEFVMIEEAISGREIEVAVLGNAEAQASVPGEVVPSREFYDYEDKYVDGGARLLIPAPLDPEVAESARTMAVAAFKALRVDGMARVDFFYEEGGRGLLVNEVNTIPGFTPISMYPKLWEASGLPYPKLLDELIRLALERNERRRRFATDWRRAEGT
jgi:D-alanine-D-alanine ligase